MGIKSSQIWSKSGPKSIYIIWHFKTFFNTVLKVAKILGYICKKIYPKNLSKIAQSGHSDDWCQLGNDESKIHLGAIKIQTTLHLYYKVALYLGFVHLPMHLSINLLPIFLSFFHLSVFYLSISLLFYQSIYCEPSNVSSFLLSFPYLSRSPCLFIYPPIFRSFSISEPLFYPIVLLYLFACLCSIQILFLCQSVSFLFLSSSKNKIKTLSISSSL